MLLGYRAMTFVLNGQRKEAHAAFLELANARSSRDSNDEYARLYARMFIAFLHDELDEADRIASELQRLQVRPSVKNILFPLERPSELARQAEQEHLAGPNPDKIRSHFDQLQSSYRQTTIRR